MNDRYEKEQEEENEPEENEAEPENVQNTPEIPSTRRMTQIQIICCAVLLAAAVLLRLYGGDVYATVKGWYHTQLNDSILPDEQVENVKQTVVGLWSNISQPRTGPSLSSSSSAQEESSAVSSASPSSGQVTSAETRKGESSRTAAP